ncbi:MAG: lipoyl synthase [Legionellales bacterium]|nr:lipoyl synthase [Legionellales bacterium]
MQTFRDIAIVVDSGQKYKTAQGFSAIRDGVKANANTTSPTRIKKPSWLKIRVESSEKFKQVKQLVTEHQLSTVCEEAKCPNMSECWSHGTATVMLLGSVCTRACQFCSVDTGNPRGWLDANEPANTAKTVAVMQLQYVVLTSVDRDDLPDGGAAHYAKAITAIKHQCPATKVEALTPDFQGRMEDVQTILASGVDVFAQNVETVERLTHPIRDPRASYQQTLDVLAYAKRAAPQVITKTSLMLGLGETDVEIAQTMDDLRAIGVDVLTLGQYLQPTSNHYPIERFVPPADFAKYRQWGLEKGFMEVASGPLVRSSYRADRIFAKDNLGMSLVQQDEPKDIK